MPRSKRHRNRNKPREAPGRRTNFTHVSSALLLDNVKQICEAADSDITHKLRDQIENFRKLLSQNVLEGEVFFWIMKLANKVSESSCQQIKSEIILLIWNHQPYITNFQSYLKSLPYTKKQSRIHNPSFWNNAEQFWTAFVTFCRFIIRFSPRIAVIKCPCLLNVAKLCLNSLKRQCYIILQTDFEAVFSNLMKDLDEAMAVGTSKKNVKKFVSRQADLFSIGNQEVPNNFREISLMPNKSEIVDEEHPFVRPNIIYGAYSNIDHYLDVQFRLLREDCFKGLRDGIQTFIGDNNHKKFDCIRIYKNVKFLGLHAFHNRLGYLVQWQDRALARKKKDFFNRKRLKFGSLLVFSRDNFKNIILATVVDRDQNLLSKGQIMVNIQDGGNSISSYFNLPFVMVESQVYFEPYYHILKALQSQDFAENFPMKKYIVDVEPFDTVPSYLTDSTTYQVTDYQNPDNTLKIPVLDFLNWPKASSLNLNLLQYEAYKLALTREFAVIQGPPGTGKTYLGLMVARTLIENFKTTFPDQKKKKQMLVICYTNHALDQFLEGLLNVTSNIIRIGNRSKNRKLDAFNLSNLRRNLWKSGVLRGNHVAYRKKEHELNKITKDVTRLQKYIQQSDQELDFEQFEDWLESETMLELDNIKGWLLGNVVCERTCSVSLSAIKQEISAQNKQINELENIIDSSYDEMSDLQIENMQQNINDLSRKRTNLENLHEVVKSRLLRGPHGYDKFVLTRNTNLYAMNQEDRWAVYFEFHKVLNAKLWRELQMLEVKYKKTLEMLEEVRSIRDRCLLETSQVIGITTTGAARLKQLLQSLQSPIVIVEEAAKVFEAHIVASLTRHCKHLILIGDHQQLRPSPACYEIEKHYNLGVSLFERMIKNGIHCRTLQVQHRMRPEIASLIMPSIYKDLKNHPSVEKFPKIKGVRSNLYFVNHNHYEQKADHVDMSRSNQHEANFLIKLAIYLRQQGYQPEEITILAAYNAQMFLMKDMQKSYDMLKNVLITAIDNYQGEENKIILLSLVRSNLEGSIGFLSTKNRVGVALSRAREGLFIIGNMNCLMEMSKLWYKINVTLENQNAISNTLTLKCENHIESLTKVTSISDFDKVPEGGCLLICNRALACGHICRRICHAYDKNHDKFNCRDPCAKIICELRHPCPGKCGEECKECIVKVLKDLPCGHEISILCSKKPEDHKCQVQIDVVLRACGHKNTTMCFKADDKVKCKMPCVDRLPCGHPCIYYCHKNKNLRHTDICCKQPCARRKQGCSKKEYDDKHMCKKLCFEECTPCLVVVDKKRSYCNHIVQVACHDSPDKTKCEKICKRTISSCGHKCTLMCFAKCVCSVKVPKKRSFCSHNVNVACHESPDQTNCSLVVPKKRSFCSHIVNVACRESPDRTRCENKCDRTIPSCGHKCKLLCFEKCVCSLKVSKKRSFCSHNVNVACHESPDQTNCMNKCNRTISSCGHKCTLTCFEKCVCYLKKVPKKRSFCSHIVNVACHESPDLTRCENKCDRTIPSCGHKCKLLCFEKCVCSLKVSKKRSFCSHNVNVACHESPDQTNCMNKCNRTISSCGHKCTLTCFEKCVCYLKKVPKKRSYCNHIVNVACRESPDQTNCINKCDRTISSCGHKCALMCIEKCVCYRKVRKRSLNCPHRLTLQCYQSPLRKLCIKKCTRSLPCGHPCTQDCREECDATLCQVRVTSISWMKGKNMFLLPCNIKQRGLFSTSSLSYSSNSMFSTLFRTHERQYFCRHFSRGFQYDLCIYLLCNF